MKIIFGGLDNTGKSTQIENIRKYYKDKGFICTKSSFIHGFTPEEYKNQAIKEYSNVFKIFNTDVDIICDRLHDGETVYGEIYRKYSGDYVYRLENEYNLKEIDDLYLIILIDNPKNVLDREDGLSFSTDIEKKKLEIQKFKDFYMKSSIKNKILININNLSIKEVKDIIIEFLEGKIC